MNNKTELQKHEVTEGGRKPPRGNKQNKGATREHGHRWLFLAVDLFLLAIIVGAVIFIAIALSPTDAADGDATEVRTVIYQLEFHGADADLFSVTGGESVINLDTGNVIGTVEYHDGGSVYSQYVDSVKEENGKYFVEKVTYTDDLKTYVVTVRAEADYEPGVGYFVGGSRLAVGGEYRLRFANYTGTGVCTFLQRMASN